MISSSAKGRALLFCRTGRTSPPGTSETAVPAPALCHTGVCEKEKFARAFALQPSSRNCSSAPDLVF